MSKTAELAEDVDFEAELKRVRAEKVKLERDNETLGKSLREAREEADKIHAKLSETSGEARDRRHELKQVAEEKKAVEERLRAIEAERDEAATTLAAKEKEFGEFKAQVESHPNVLLDEVNDLKGKLRQQKHAGAYSKIARSLRVDVENEAKFADLLNAARYPADDDEPDEGKIAESFKQAVEKRPWLLVPEPTPTPPPPPTNQANGHAPALPPITPPAKPGPGSDRGAPAETGRTTLAPQRVPGRL